MTPSHADVPTLTDLVRLWLEETMPSHVFNVIHFTMIMQNQEWYILYFGPTVIGYIYDADMVLVNHNEDPAGNKIYAADPEFFNKLGEHIKMRVKRHSK